MRGIVWSVLVVTALSAGVSGVWAADAVEPATTAPATASGRTARDILSDMDEATSALDKVAIPMETFFHDATARQKAAPAMLPPMAKISRLMDELAGIEPRFAEMVQANQYQLLAMRSLLGDKSARQTLEDQKSGADKEKAMQADLALATADWWAASSDAAAQEKVLDHLTSLAKGQPDNDTVTQALLSLATSAPASPALAEKAQKVAEAMNTQTAGVLKAKTAELAELIAPFKDKIGKPFSLTLQTADGKTLDTATLKGQVLLVDFWATWCPPCVSESDALEALYKDLHGQGLEIIGVSEDESVAALKPFLSQHSGITWPMAFDADQKVASDLGVKAFPTKLVIDRAGVLREVVPSVRPQQGERLRNILKPYLDSTATGAAGAM
jgi:peroxiredoxin